METFTQGSRDFLVAVPAQLDHRCLEAGETQRGRQPALAGAGMEDDVAIAAGVIGQRKAAADRGGD